MNSAAILLALVLPLGPQQDEDPDVLPGSVTLDEEVVRLPFTLGKTRPIPVIEAKVNGQGPFKFYYDTGASVCVLHSGFVEELGIEVIDTTKIGDHTQNARIDADVVRLDRLDLGGVHLEAVPAVAFDRTTLQGDTIRGVLGLPLFHQHLLTLDYGKGHLEISAKTLPEKGQGILSYEATPLPEFDIDVGGKPLTCHIDSGSPTGFALPASVVEALPHKTEPRLLGRARTVNSEFELFSVQLDTTITVGDLEFEAPEVLYNEILPNALIGYRELKNLVVSIDQRTKRLRLVRSEAPAAPEPRKLGVGIGLRGDELFVSQVMPDSAAEKAGLKTGDVLVSIDGEAATRERIGAALQGSDPVRVKVQRGEETLELVLFAK